MYGTLYGRPSNVIQAVKPTCFDWIMYILYQGISILSAVFMFYSINYFLFNKCLNALILYHEWLANFVITTTTSLNCLPLQVPLK